MQSDRIIGLDIVRATAITMVVIFHSVPILKPLSSIPAFGPYIHEFLSLSEPFGLLGVELFFILSGFLIGTILIKTFMSTDKYRLSDIRNFLVRRWFRTLPNYWLILIANILVYSWFLSGIFQVSWLRYCIFTQNLLTPNPSFFPESWSLAIEEWFYLSFPLGLYLFSLIFRKPNKQKVFLYTFVFYAAIPLILRFSKGTEVTDPLYFDGSIRKIVAYRLDAISYGCLMAWLLLYHKETVMKFKKTLLFISLSGITMLTAIHFAGIYPSLSFYRKYASFRLFINAFLLTLIPVFFSLCIPYAVGIRTLKNRLASNVITFVSKISYSLYLIHFSLIYVPFWEYRKFTVNNCLPFFLLYWLVVLGLSSLIYKYFEYPVMNLRKRVSKSDPAV